MIKKVNAMLDLETLATTPQSQILSIGGVKFNPHSTDEPYADFYFKFEIDEQEEAGRITSESTLTWWSGQSTEVIEDAFGPENRTAVKEVLKALKKWYVGCSSVWAQGVCFDITMLEDICRQFGEPVPWQFYHVEDARTIINRMVKDPRKQFSFAAHNALEDSRYQAKALQIAFQYYNFEK